MIKKHMQYIGIMILFPSQFSLLPLFASLGSGPNIYLTYSRQRQSRKLEVIAEADFLLTMLVTHGPDLPILPPTCLSDPTFVLHCTKSMPCFFVSLMELCFITPDSLPHFPLVTNLNFVQVSASL